MTMRKSLFRTFVFTLVASLLFAVCLPHHHHGDDLCMGMATEHDAPAHSTGHGLPLPDKGNHAEGCIAHSPCCRTAPQQRFSLTQPQRQPLWAAATWHVPTMPLPLGIGMKACTPYYAHPLRPPSGRCKTPRAPPAAALFC